MEFHEYLKSKKIDPTKFKAGNPDLFEEFALHFSQMHPASFTAQKLYLINRIRRDYLLVASAELPKAEEAPSTPAGPPRPKMIPKIKR